MSIKHISLLVCAVAALAIPSGVSAQFTAAVAPPRVKLKADTIVKQDSVRRATVALAARVTDMKKWVDSAAGVSIPAVDSTKLSMTKGDAAKTAVLKDSVILSRNARIRADSAASIATVEVHDSTGLKAPADSSSAKTVPPTSMRDTPPRDDTKRFSTGAPAPATASMLPFLAVAGATTLLAGAALRRT